MEPEDHQEKDKDGKHADPEKHLPAQARTAYMGLHPFILYRRTVTAHDGDRMRICTWSRPALSRVGRRRLPAQR